MTLKKPLQEQITDAARRWLRIHNQGRAVWECPVCPDSPYLGPGGRHEADPLIHAENCMELRDEAFDKLDRADTRRMRSRRRR